MQNSYVQQAGQWVAGIQPQQLTAERQERLQAMLLYNLAAALAGQMPADPLQPGCKAGSGDWYRRQIECR
jgi:hypothetical protein